MSVLTKCGPALCGALGVSPLPGLLTLGTSRELGGQRWEWGGQVATAAQPPFHLGSFPTSATILLP